MNILSSIQSIVRHLLCLPPAPTRKDVSAIQAAANKREARIARRQALNAKARNLNPCNA